MKGNKHWIWKVTIINIIVCSSIVYSLFDMWFPSLPINSMMVNRIEVLRQEIGKPTVIIENKEDIEAIKEIFANAGRGVSDRPACPFDLPIIFCEGNIKNVVLWSTDSCGSFQCNGKYYALSKAEREQLITLLIKLGVSPNSLRW